MNFNLQIFQHKKDSKKIFYLLFLIIYFLALLYLAQKIYIWEDEAYSLHTSSHNLGEVIRLSYNFEGQPAFYFALLSIWRHLNPSIFFARLLSVIFIAGSAYFFKKLVLLFSDNNGAKWMVIIFLLNPFTVWAALEIRLYALVILLSTISIYCFLKYYLDEKIKYLYILLIVSLIGLYTQYFFVLLLTSFALSILLFKGWTKYLKFCLYFIPVFILFLPNFIFLPQQISMGQTYLEEPLAEMYDILRTFQDYILALNSIQIKETIRWLIKLIFIFILLFIIYDILNKKAGLNKLFKELIKTNLAIFSICVSLYLIIIPTFSLIFQEKYMSITFPLFIFIFSFSTISQWRKFLYPLLSLYFLSLIVIKYKYPEKTYDFKSVSKYIEKIELKKEPIIFYGKSILPPFQFYYHGMNQLYTLPPLIYNKDYYEEKIKDTAELIKQIRVIPSLTNSYLLITESIPGFIYKKPLSEQAIQKSINDRYGISVDTIFKSRNSDYFLRIQRLEKK